MKALIKKYMKSHWKSDDFGRGRNATAKARHKRIIKKKAYNDMRKDFDKE